MTNLSKNPLTTWGTYVVLPSMICGRELDAVFDAWADIPDDWQGSIKAYFDAHGGDPSDFYWD